MAHRDLGPSAETLILAGDLSIPPGYTVPEAIDVIMRRWHDDNHEGSYEFCDEQPCRAIRQQIEIGDTTVAPGAGDES